MLYILTNDSSQLGVRIKVYAETGKLPPLLGYVINDIDGN